MPSSPNRYVQVIEHIFRSKYKADAQSVLWGREEIMGACKVLGIDPPKNLGDLVYSFRYRISLPDSIQQTAPSGKIWVIRGVGAAKYSFELADLVEIVPNPSLTETKVPDATPGIIAMYALSDEQALLAKLRYNRLLDIFTGLTCYSLQNHLRTHVSGVGQTETDEIYVGVDKRGVHYVLPVQAKGGSDKLNVVQVEQDLAMCALKFKNLICRPVASQFISPDLIALFELEEQNGQVKIAGERHYRLAPYGSLTEKELLLYQHRS